VYRRILGPVYDNEKENWRILTNKEIYASVKEPTVIKTVRFIFIYNTQKDIIYEFGINKIKR